MIRRLLALPLLWSVAAAGQGEIQHATSWIANSFPGGNSSLGWVQNDVADIFVRPDGTVYTDSIWDESGREGGIYKDGKAAGYLRDLHFCGGRAITGNSSYIFAALDNQVRGKGDCTSAANGGVHKIRQYNFDGTRTAIPDLAINDETDTQKTIPGMAAGDKELFVSDPSNDLIEVYDTRSLKLLRRFSFSAPGRMALDRSGSLWVAQTGTGRIFRVSRATGLAFGHSLFGGNPTALALNRNGGLIVADGGLKPRISVYGPRGGRVRAVPVPRLIVPTGIGVDASGNLYVASRLGGTNIRKLSPRGAVMWQLTGLAFVDAASPTGPRTASMCTRNPTTSNWITRKGPGANGRSAQ